MNVKKNCSVIAVMYLLAMPVSADPYAGFGLGLGEPCEDRGQSSFTDGECRHPGIMLRAFMGGYLTEFLRLEAGFDALVDPRSLLDSSHGNSRVSAFTLGTHALVNLPITPDLQIFAGPGLGASMVYVSWDHRSYYDDVSQETYESSESDTTFGLNYGWTLGMEFESTPDSSLGIRWQTWNSMDSETLYGKEFSTNYLFVTVRVNM